MSLLLSQTAEYALRAMSHLAERYREEEGTRAADLAEETGVPLAYLQKILRRLVVAELLESRKGHGGGFRLAFAPEEISFDDVLRATDVELDEERCAFGWGECDSSKPCALHPAWVELKGRMIDWAATTTLADAKPPPARRRRR